MAKCKWCGITIYWEQEGEAWLPFIEKDGELVRHLCPRSPTALKIASDKVKRRKMFLEAHPEVMEAARAKYRAKELNAELDNEFHAIVEKPTE